VIEQPVNLSTVSYLGVFSRAEQRVLQAIFKAIAEGGGRCVATLATLARDSNTSKSTTRNAIAQAVAIGLLIHIKSEGVRPLAYARNLLATRDCFRLALTVISPQPI